MNVSRGGDDEAATIPGRQAPATRPPSGRVARPTMKDVADRVGVSIKSVSRVLNGEAGVSPATTERILQVAKDLGFRRNDLARDLRRGDRTGTIGLVLKQTSNHFYDELIRGIDEIAERRDALVITAASRNSERERETLLALSSRRVDGLLVVPDGEDHSFLAAEQAMGIALVFVDRPPRHLNTDVVLTGDAEGGRTATAHLIAHGHERIGVIGTSAQLYTVQERMRGYRDALTKAGIPWDDHLIRLDRTTADEARSAAADLLAMTESPTALFTLNSMCTLGAARALRAAEIGHQVALVGFDDFDVADLLTPPITVISHDVIELGRRAAELLFDRIEGYTEPPQRVHLPTSLIARGSGELRPYSANL